MNRKTLLIIFLLLFAAVPALAGEITIHVKGMVCGFCAQGIKKKFSARPEVQSVRVSLEEKRVQLTTKKDQDVSDEAIREVLKDAGYTVETIERKP